MLVRQFIKPWLILGFFIFTLPGIHAYAAPPTLGPNLNLSKAAGNQTETAVAINPKDNNQLFVVSRNEAGGLWTARSSDGGMTWTSKLFGAGSPQAGDILRAYGNASVAWDEYGNLFLTYLAQSASTAATYVALSVSKDGGASFNTPTGSGAAILLPSTIVNAIGDQPAVAVGPGTGGYPGSVWLSYFSNGIWVSGANVSADGSVGAFVSMPLPAQPASVNFADIAVGPNGEVVVSYGPNQGPAGGQIFTQVNLTGLAGITANSFMFPSWGNIFTNVGGFSLIPPQPNLGIDAEPGLAYDRSNGPHHGRVYLVYTDSPPGNPSDTNIYVRYSDNYGINAWSAPVKVNDDSGVNSQFLPHISLDQSTGQIAVTWYDARFQLDNAEYYGTFSRDGGATFDANFKISKGISNQSIVFPAGKRFDYGGYSGNAFVNGKLVPAWADNSNSTNDNPERGSGFDVYTAIVQAPGTNKPVATVSFPSSGANGWYASPSVNGAATASSTGSVIAAISCNGASILGFNGLGSASASAGLSVSSQGLHNVSCTATDAAGNTQISAPASVNIDSVAPTLSPGLPGTNAFTLLNAIVPVIPNAVDTGSGLYGANCGAVISSTLGSKTLSCAAIDNAGNSASAVLAYTVGLGISNLKITPTTPATAGSLLTVTFQLTDANATVISDALAYSVANCGGVSVVFDTTAPVCAAYNQSLKTFQAQVRVPTKQLTGVYPLTVKLTQAGLSLAVSTKSVAVK